MEETENESDECQCGPRLETETETDECQCGPRLETENDECRYVTRSESGDQDRLQRRWVILFAQFLFLRRAADLDPDLLHSTDFVTCVFEESGREENSHGGLGFQNDGTVKYER